MISKDTPVGTLVSFKRGPTILKYLGDGYADLTFKAKTVVRGLTGKVGDVSDDWCRDDFELITDLKP